MRSVFTSGLGLQQEYALMKGIVRIRGEEYAAYEVFVHFAFLMAELSPENEPEDGVTKTFVAEARNNIS
jgi:hypothetical protein